jgi:hypothetical protein
MTAPCSIAHAAMARSACRWRARFTC